tara:strand:- start:295 stop:837 length:543 start_codon:yes stop_codon:yes gene_type:complete
MKFLEKLFTNKIFLYVVAFLTIMTVLGYISEKKYDSILFLIAFGIIIHRFNKNMSVVLLLAVFITSLFNYAKSVKNNNNLEGATTMGMPRTADYLESFDDEHNHEDYMEEEEEEEDFEVPTLIDGFRSRYKNGRNSSIARNRGKVQQYNQIKDTYNGLITTIKAKTAEIKEMTRKLKGRA